MTGPHAEVANYDFVVILDDTKKRRVQILRQENFDCFVMAYKY